MIINKIHIYFLIVILIVSCSNNNIKRGLLYSKEHSEISYEVSRNKAIDKIYYYIAEKTAYSINRKDFNILAVELKDNNLINFFYTNSKNIKIKEYKENDNYYTEINIKDKSIYNRTLELLQKIKKEGSIDDKIFRANASIDISENAKINPYTKQILTHNALKRAYESLYKLLLDYGIEVNEAVRLTNNAYIIEESYSSKKYNVVIETEL